MNEVIYKFLENSIIISAAVILLLVLSFLLGNKTSPMLRRTCWIFLALFFLIPVRPTVFTISLPQEDSSPTIASVYSQVRDYRTMLDMRVSGRTFESPNNAGGPVDEPGQPYEVQVDNKEIIGSDFNVNSESIPVTEQAITRSWNISMIIPYIWMLGMITTLIFYITGYTRFNRRIKRQAIRITGCVLNDLLDDVRREIGLGRHIDLAVCPIISTPVVTGFFRPVIYLPDEHIDYKDLRFILMHEATHIKNGDMWCKLLSLLVMIVHWFNPVVYLLNRAINIDSELACDTAILRKVDEEQRMQYGETVFQAAKRSWQPEAKRYRLTDPMLVSAFSDSGKSLRRRLSAIIKRTNTKRWIAVCCTLALSAGVITSGLVSCGSNEEDDEPEKEYAFLPEFTSLSALAGNLPNMGNITIEKNTVYFTSTSELKSDTLFRTTRIFTLDLNESALAYLPNYAATSPPPEAQGGGVYINAMQVDADGNLWVVEESSFVEFDFPFHFDLDEAEVDEIWEHTSLRESSYNIRKLDSTGAELQSIDINHILNASDWYGIFSFHIDDNENLFIGFGQSIYVLNAEGETVFSLDTGGDFIISNSIIRLSDGRTAFFDWGGTTAAQSLRVIDVQGKSWGENINIPENVLNVFSGFDEYLAIISDSINLSGIHIDTGEILPIINWADSIGMPLGLGNVTFLQDGRVQFTTTTFGHGFISDIELITLSRTPLDELPERITLTLTTDNEWLPSEFTSAVAEFNRTNAFYQIEINVIERSWHTMSDDMSRLALDIITGGGPDIIDITNMPFQQWAARGLFVDLYDFIDVDPTINRNDILDVVLRNAETNGRLYQMFHGFKVSTLIGNPEIVGNEPGWTFGDLIAVLEANPQATNAFGVFTDGMALFKKLFMNHVDSFVNWETGLVDFDNDKFIEFLEFSVELRRVFNWWGENRDDDSVPASVMWGVDIMEEMVASGEIIILDSLISTFNSPYLIQQSFGKDFIFKGYPTDSGSGNSLHASPRLAISSMSENKQGAWEFIRMLLSEEWQRENYNEFAFTTNRTVFEEGLAQARAGDEQVYWIYWLLPGQMREDPSAFADKTLALINSVEGIPSGFDPILTIVFEGIDDIFNGRSTPQEAARIIQSRAAIFVAEQG